MDAYQRSLWFAELLAGQSSATPPLPQTAEPTLATGAAAGAPQQPQPQASPITAAAVPRGAGLLARARPQVSASLQAKGSFADRSGRQNPAGLLRTAPSCAHLSLSVHLIFANARHCVFITTAAALSPDAHSTGTPSPLGASPRTPRAQTAAQASGPSPGSFFFRSSIPRFPSFAGDSTQAATVWTGAVTVRDGAVFYVLGGCLLTVVPLPCNMCALLCRVFVQSEHSPVTPRRTPVASQSRARLIVRPSPTKPGGRSGTAQSQPQQQQQQPGTVPVDSSAPSSTVDAPVSS
jgi:hypothetical protein